MLLPYAEQSSPSKAPKHLHDFIWYQALLQTSRTEMPKPGTCMVLCCAVLLVFLGLLEGRTAQWKKCDSQTDEKYWTWIPVLQISLGLGLHKEHFEGKDENKRVIRPVPLCSIVSSTGIPHGNSSMGWDGWAKRVSSTIATKSEGVSAEGQQGFFGLGTAQWQWGCSAFRLRLFPSREMANNNEACYRQNNRTHKLLLGFCTGFNAGYE